ncbi:low molecular weight protein-tyrosine-phosphatase [Dyadobacter psychrotolerans]|uniref:protein-tyrosine-phosphatase n=1 Tax=Dyadobacter psychrotolerans TaxID=2541721 RepID=A0A4R5DLH0_9BACT|nr:low molecular weight protein-tyrosine-phosphatase [Dyadobacter psychrotolerans]TDE11715.1 low molecular weight phosphotyrosine protein phosphatase [Dyadobacter psychrotolerans]
MIQVLFVCLGNICRSPIAEGVFKELVAQKGLEESIQCDSAGTAAYHVGSLPDKRMRKVALGNGITLTHCARQLAYEDFINYDYILAMDTANFENIRKESFRANGVYAADQQLMLYRMFDPDRENEVIVPDPYYGEISDFDGVYAIVKRCGTSFLNFLIEKHDLVVKIRD